MKRKSHITESNFDELLNFSMPQVLKAQISKDIMRTMAMEQKCLQVVVILQSLSCKIIYKIVSSQSYNLWVIRW